MTSKDEHFMKQALELAQRAYQEQEVPIGAVITKDDKIIATGYNQKEGSQNVIHHAEIVAIEKACSLLKSWRLNDCTLYTTLEPCLMCAGAIYQARIKTVVYGAKDPKGGALGSLYEIHNDKRLNHLLEIKDGVLEKDSQTLLKSFFKKRR